MLLQHALSVSQPVFPLAFVAVPVFVDKSSSPVFEVIF